MIKALLFDLGGVIVPLDFQQLKRNFATLSGRSIPELEVRLAATDLPVRYERGDLDSASFHAELSRTIGLDLDFPAFDRLWNSLFPPGTLLPESLFQTLKQTHRLILLSNTNELHFRHLRATLPHLSHFHGFVLSYEVRVMKPDPGIFARAIEAAGCAPEECFYIDDVEKYVEGARTAGIDAVRFESAEQVERELRKRGVL
ncbi:MAG: HAD family phosphatase [Acidobacteria bacterium]|nr:HAD family phosphatase [Acidobacteriota bacterium]